MQTSLHIKFENLQRDTNIQIVGMYFKIKCGRATPTEQENAGLILLEAKKFFLIILLTGFLH